MMDESERFVILRSPTRQSRYGDGAPEGPKNLLSRLLRRPEQILRCAQDDRPPLSF